MTVEEYKEYKRCMSEKIMNIHRRRYKRKCKIKEIFKVYNLPNK